jgi:hypothetical protein
LYETLDKPPRPGSLLEVLCVMLQMRREVARYQETRAIVQALRDGEEGESTRKAFEAYRHALMPFLTDEEKKEEQRMVELLQAEVSRGGLKIQSLGEPQHMVSRLQQQAQLKDPNKTVNWRRTRRW